MTYHRVPLIQRSLILVGCGGGGGGKGRGLSLLKGDLHTYTLRLG